MSVRSVVQDLVYFIDPLLILPSFEQLQKKLCNLTINYL